jgi:hypothetical protein
MANIFVMVSNGNQGNPIRHSFFSDSAFLTDYYVFQHRPYNAVAIKSLLVQLTDAANVPDERAVVRWSAFRSTEKSPAGLGDRHR